MGRTELHCMNRFWLGCVFLFVLSASGLASADRKADLSSLLSQGVLVYYGHEPQDKTNFTQAKVVILEPAHWSTRSLRKLRAEGKIVLGYLSVGELIANTRTRQNYRVLSQNEEWGSLRIDPTDPDWRATMIRRTQLANERELDGLMLDTVDVVALHPEASEGMVALVEAIRKEMPDKYLMTNRGFAVLERVASQVDGVVFENSTNRNFSAVDRAWVEAQCDQLRRLRMAVVLLDYAEQSDPEQSRALVDRYGWATYLAPSISLAKRPSEDG